MSYEIIILSVNVILLGLILFCYIQYDFFNLQLKKGIVSDVVYWTKNGKYVFEYRKIDGSWRAYIKDMPEKDFLRLKEKGRIASDGIYNGTKEKFLNSEPYIYSIKRIYSFDEIREKSENWADNI